MVAILYCYTFGADEVAAVGTPPAPRLCGRPRRVPISWPACACRNSTSRTAPRGDCRAPQSPARRSLEAREAAAGRGEPPPPGLIDLDPADKVLRALEVERGRYRADGLPELWLDHHELDSPSDLPAGY